MFFCVLLSSVHLSRIDKGIERENKNEKDKKAMPVESVGECLVHIDRLEVSVFYD